MVATGFHVSRSVLIALRASTGQVYIHWLDSPITCMSIYQAALSQACRTESALKGTQSPASYTLSPVTFKMGRCERLTCL